MTALDGSALREWLDGRARDDQFSGVALVREGTSTIFEHAAGLAHRGHRVPVTMSTRFQVASITKMITATTALRLVERGALSLDRPLTGYLPPDLRPTALDERHTLHHLLSHTSGLPNYHDDEDETWASFTAAWDRVPVYRARGPKDLIPLFADLPARSELGEYVYGDANFVLVGALIEWVEGKPFGQVATQEVLVPAGMAHSGFFTIDLEPDGFATAYLASDEPADTWRSNIYSVPAGGMPDGGLSTTAPDLMRFLDALQSGALLQSETLTTMLTPHGLEEDTPEGYGYGMELVVEDDRVIIYGHGGADPGVSAMFSHYVDAGMTIAVLCNLDRGSWAVMQRLTADLGLHDPRE
jgi:CubicO group peptidase (beta-lactamase class C family)